MKKSLACVLNGHRWDYKYTGGFYKCMYCSCWAHNLAFDYQGKDVTKIRSDGFPNLK
jgi:hypothetical protein